MSIYLNRIQWFELGIETYLQKKEEKKKVIKTQFLDKFNS